VRFLLGSRRLRLAAVIAAGVVSVALAALVVAVPAPTRARPQTLGAADSLVLPDPVRPAFSAPEIKGPRDTAFDTFWAPVLRSVEARDGPGLEYSGLAMVSSETPEGTINLVVVLGRTEDATGRLWVKVRLPVLPNNTVGWVPRSALGGYEVVRTRLVVDLEQLTATLYRRGRPVFAAPVGVGEPAWPTPEGHFYVRNKLTDFASPAYGPLAFGTSARSAVLTDWPAGGFVGIHGTDRPDLLPGRVSHGCIRMRNRDIIELGRLMPVGTPVEIR
jgi:L,D-transpeptidase catalytic domain